MPAQRPVPASAPLAVIDIGSNSGRVIVVAQDERQHLETLADAHTRLSLVRDIDRDGRLGAPALERTVAALQDFAAVAASAGARRTVAVATAAVREAPNRDEFCARVLARSGVSLRVLAGDEEALHAFTGGVHGLPVEDGLLIDIGGGSAELLRFRQRRPVHAWTLPLGALRLTERFLRTDPAKPSEIAALRAHVRDQIGEAGVPPLAAGESLVGTGGTVRNLAKMARARRSGYPVPRVHGHTVNAAEVTELTARALARSRARRARIPGLSSDRAGSITGGLLTIEVLFDHLGADRMVVSGQGLREGIALDALAADLPAATTVRRSSLLSVAARFSTWNERRGRRRARVAGDLFNALCPTDGDPPRHALEAAALVLDAGRSLDYYQRWEHAAQIVLRADLRGYSHQSIALCAGIILAAGRQGSPSRFADLLDSGDRQVVERAGLLLALADDVERRTLAGASPLSIPPVVERRRVLVQARLPADWLDDGQQASRFRALFKRRLEVVAPEVG